MNLAIVLQALHDLSFSESKYGLVKKTDLIAYLRGIKPKWPNWSSPANKAADEENIKVIC